MGTLLRSGLVGMVAAFIALGACSSDDARSPEDAPGVLDSNLIQTPVVAGNVTTLAGNGTPGATDAAVATNGTLNDPMAVATTPDGAIYIADRGNNSIRRIKPDGSLDTFLRGQPNLIKDPGGEVFPYPSPWQITAGSWPMRQQCTDGTCPPAQDGSRYFGGATPGTNVLVDVIDVTAYSAAIAAGTQKFHFSGFMRTGTDTAQIQVEYIDSSNHVVGTYDTGIKTGLGSWTEFVDARVAPPTTTKIDVWLVARTTSATGNAFFDSLELRAMPSAPAAGDNLVKNGGGETFPYTPDWSITNGTWPNRNECRPGTVPCPSAAEGSHYFGGSGTVSTLVQTIDITPFAATIATGAQKFHFSGLFRTAQGDTAEFQLEYLNSANQIVLPLNLGPRQSTNAWTEVANEVPAPPTATKVNIRLIGRTVTAQQMAFFDAIHFWAVPIAGAPAPTDALLIEPKSLATICADFGSGPVCTLYIAAANGLFMANTSDGTIARAQPALGYVPPKKATSVSVQQDATVVVADGLTSTLHVRQQNNWHYATLPNGSGSVLSVATSGVNTQNVWTILTDTNGSTGHQVRAFTCPASPAPGSNVTCNPSPQGGPPTFGMGLAGFVDDLDGFAGGERLSFPSVLTAGQRFPNANGPVDVFVSENGNSAIRRHYSDFTRVLTGTGTAGFLDAAAALAKFNLPAGALIMPDSSLVIADRGNNRIRKLGCGAAPACFGFMQPNPIPPMGSCGQPSADDANACTTDTCDVIAIRHTNMPTGFSCNDGNGCTAPDTCNASAVCQAGPPVPTNDSNNCTVDSCDSATGAVSHAPKTYTDSDPADCMVPTCNPVDGTALYVPALESTACGGANSNRLCNQAGICEAAAPPVVAPVLSASAGTSFGDATSFIYEGANKVQTGVTTVYPGTTTPYIDKARAGWLVGYVKTAAGSPMSNVVVTVADNSNYGQTLTRADGRFDLIVNGGATYTLRFAKTGHFGVDRQIYVSWEQTAALEDVILLTPDAKGTAITPNSGSQQVAVGNTTTGTGDDVGTRTPVVIMPKSTKVVVDGVERTAAMTLRLTEYTTGPDGTKRMPAPLPPATGYTYAVEVSADEALTASRIDFKDAASGQAKDVFVYLEDFIGFAANMPACINGCQGVAACMDACRSVPVGYYDRSKLAWISSKSGRLIKVISITNGVAAVDVTGDNVVDDVLTDAQFTTSLGFTSDELTTLGGRYAAGAALWRVPISHMTPYDCNWPALPPTCDASGACPVPPPPPATPPPPDCGGGAGHDNSKPGSIIGCDTQSLGEETVLPGTPYALHYSSRRTPGYAEGRQKIIALTGSQVHSQAKIIKVLVAIAGRRYEKLFTPVAPATTFAPNLSWTFDIWDGKDAAGRTVVGTSIANISVTTHYAALYTPSAIFGAYPTPSAALTTNPRAFYPQSITYSAPLMGSVPEQAWSLGGWTVDQHHWYDVLANTLFLGSGEVRPSAASVPTITRLLTGVGAGSGNEGSVAVGPNGDIFVADYGGHIIRRIRGGVTSTVVGSGTSSCPSGQPASTNDNAVGTNARLHFPRGVAVGPDGSVYITGGESTVRKATPNPDGTTYTVTTVAGIACQNASSTGTGDNGDAKLAKLHTPVGIAFGPDRSIYIAENFRVRRVDPSGIIKTVAGTGSGGLSGGDRANEGKLASTVPAGSSGKYAIAVSADGTLFIAQSYTLTSVDPNGRLHYLNRPFLSTQPVGDGVPLKDESIGLALSSLAIRPDGSIVFNDEDFQRILPGGTSFRKWLRSLNSAGTVTTQAGSNPDGSAPPPKGLAIGNGPILTAALAAAPDGSVIAVASGIVYRIEIPKTTAVGCNDVNAKYQVPGGDEDYCFDATGRHIKTINSRTGQPVFTFEYTSNVLTGITDRAGLKTTVSKLTSPSRYELVAPFKQKTTIALDSVSGYATSIGDMLGAITLAPMANGLLDNLRDRNLSLFDFTFDDTSGLLTADASPVGTQTLSRVLLSNGRLVTHKTPGLRETKYETILDAARVVKHTTTFPDLTTVLKQSFPKGLETRKDRDGTVSETTLVLDPTFSTTSLVSSTTKVTLPSGLAKTTQEARDTPISITGGKSQETRTLYTAATNAPFTKTTRQYTTSGTDLASIGAAQQIVVQSPVGRKATRVLDKAGRITKSQVGNLTPTLYTYDTAVGHEGQLHFIKRGTRVTELDYRTTYESDPSNQTPDADAGFVERMIDGLGAKTDFKRDIFGRARTVVEAKGVVGQEGASYFDWDGNGNLKLVTPPGRPDHAQQYDVFNGLKQYTPPTVTGVTSPQTVFVTTPDRTPDSETRPDGLKISYAYVTSPQNTDQLDTITLKDSGGTSLGTLDYDYFPSSSTNGAGKIQSIAGPYGSTKVTFAYDGRLTTSASWSGDVTASVAWTYNSLFLKSSETITPTGTGVSYFGYDNDQLLTCVSGTAPAAGASPTCGVNDLVLTRSAEHGLVTQITVGKVKEQVDYSDSAPESAGTDTDLPDHAFGELRRQKVTFDDGSASGVLLAELTYDTATDPRDELGRIKLKTEALRDALSPNTFRSNSFDYEYDERNRLENVYVNSVDPNTPTESFFYDTNNNRTSYAGPIGNISSTVYDNQDRLMTYGATTFTYGKNGEISTRTVGGVVTSYSYDALGNLTKVHRSNNANDVAYLVDGLGRRIGKTVGTTVNKRWIYRDSLNPVAEVDLITGNVVRYVYGSRPNVPDLVIRFEAGVKKTYRLITDQLGSPRLAVNTASLTDIPYRADYTAFGAASAVGGLAATSLDWIPFGFAGGIYDRDTGLVRFGARDYDPSIGRWVSKDPARFAGGINIYAYVGNDPVNKRDPQGVWPIDDNISFWDELKGVPCIYLGIWCGEPKDPVDDGPAHSPDNGTPSPGAVPPANDNDKYPPPTPMRPNCKQVRQACIDVCTDNILPGAPGCYDRGPDFQFCLSTCLRANGC